VVKTITIKDDVYKKLVALKGDESFSELIERLIEGKGIEILKKIREKVELTSEEKKVMLREIYSKRAEISFRY
jgi:predicted CopG family antitoxin